MPGSDMISTIAATLGLTIGDLRSLDGSFSGSQVLPAITRQGSEVILKITINTESPAWRGSLRELAFYRDLAGRLAIRTPQLLDHRVSDDVIALVISRHPRPAPASAWTMEDWLRLADDLATTHELDQSGDASTRRPPTALDDGVVSYWSGSGSRVNELLRAPQSLLRDATAPKPCFVHGDCHVDNISRDHGKLVWLDWQGCGTGHPAGDLAFPSVRAAPSGVRVPLPDMITAYAHRRSLEPELVLRAVHAQESLVLLFQWPHYAALNSAADNARLRDRVSTLAAGTSW